jgi:hypothetical protein
VSTDELPRRIKADVGPMPGPEAMREASIYRISEEQEVSFADAEQIYDRLLDRIHQALNNS